MTADPRLIIRMTEVRYEDYLRFLSQFRVVCIEGKRIDLRGPRFVANTGPQDYPGETTTVWSFPQRGSWATHNGDYRGNWSPYIPRNLITRYTSPGEWILDPMMGSGTTLVEAKLLGRNAIGIDVNPYAVMLARDRLAFNTASPFAAGNTEIRTYVGDARSQAVIRNETIDLIATHPPYGSIIRYGRGTVNGDLSDFQELRDYLIAIREVARECFRVLKKGRCCAVLVGDTRKYRHYVPISVGVLREFVDAGFVLLEDIVKIQHNTASERGRWRLDGQEFYKIAHEHLFVLRKPSAETELQKLDLSRCLITGQAVPTARPS